MNAISTGGLPENDDEGHRSFNQNRVQAIFNGEAAPSELECPCVQCRLLYKREVKKTSYERALDISTRMTYDAMPKEIKHLARPYLSDKAWEEGRVKHKSVLDNIDSIFDINWG